MRALRGTAAAGAAIGALVLAGCGSDSGPAAASSAAGQGDSHASASGGDSPDRSSGPRKPFGCEDSAPEVTKTYAWGSQAEVSSGGERYSLNTAKQGPVVKGSRITVALNAVRTSGDQFPSPTKLRYAVVTGDGMLCQDRTPFQMLTRGRVEPVNVSVQADSPGEDKNRVTLVALDTGGRVLAAWRTGGEVRTIAPPTGCTAKLKEPFDPDRTTSFGKAAPLRKKQVEGTTLRVAKPKVTNEPGALSSTVTVEVTLTSPFSAIVGPQQFALVDGKGNLCPRVKDVVDLPLVSSGDPETRELTFELPRGVKPEGLKVFWSSSEETVEFR